MSNEKKNKKEQLGMNPSTASGRLVKDILWKFIVDTNSHLCYHCGEEMNRGNFSIEHKVPWLHSENPLELYFDLDNISFSHLSCNCSKSRPKPSTGCGTYQSYNRGCRCKPCKEALSAYRKSIYTSEKRRERYLKTGN